MVDPSGGAPATAGGPLQSSEYVRARLAGDVLVERRGSVVVRAEVPSGRRLLVLADPRMSHAKVVAELRGLADRLARGGVLNGA